jgi:hypothetical protein
MFVQVEQLTTAAVRLPMAAILACVLAVRPRRRGHARTPGAGHSNANHLAIVGAVVMLVVGSSLARAFGIVGAAGLVRYRSKIEDPKDAGVMLSTLAIGLASGVGLWLLAIFATVFVLGVLFVIESFEKATMLFALTVKAKDAAAVQPRVERLLQSHRMKYELRSVSPEELSYDVRMADRTQDGSRVGADCRARSRERRRAVGRKEREESRLTVVPELQRDAEVVIAERVHGQLQLVFRR